MSKEKKSKSGNNKEQRKKFIVITDLIKLQINYYRLQSD